MKKDIKTIIIDARRWFERTNGNTYHSVHISIYDSNNNLTTLDDPFTYGYDDHYKYTAIKLLYNNGYLSDRIIYGDNDNRMLSLWQIFNKLKENGILIHITVMDVKRKKDL